VLHRNDPQQKIGAGGNIVTNINRVRQAMRR
jgi:hypothetical protein